MNDNVAKTSNNGKNILRKIWSWILPALLAVTMVLLAHHFIYSVNVSGPSMQPNLYNGERIFCFRKLVPIHRGSVICFDAYGVDPQCKTPGKIYVKRVIGTAGDTVRSHNGRLYINDKLVSQSYISANQRNKTNTGNWNLASLSEMHLWHSHTDEMKVPKGAYFVMGDNRKVSNDSRYFGFVPEDHVLGPVKVFKLNTNAERRNNINKFWKHYFEASND